MPDKRHTYRLLQRLCRLRQTEEVWEGAARLGRMWITPRDEAPYRPYISMFVSQGASIVRVQILANAPTPERMFGELVRAMRHPILGGGRARRPKVVHLEDPELVADLAPRLAALGIRCEERHALPTLDALLDEVERSANRGDFIPGLSDLPFATPSLIGHLYELAADFYRAAPWQWLDDWHPMEIRCPSTSDPRYAVVMGSGGDLFGLAAYDTRDDLLFMYRADTSPEEAAEVSSCAFWFEEATGISFGDLDAKAAYGWPVAAEDAYPFWTRRERGHTIPPTLADLLWLEGALGAILAYLRKYKEVCFDGSQPTEMLLPVKTIGGEIHVHLEFFAFD
ncbi:MAG: hypothetical protein U9R48_06830 [Chloroflexota bacterium]|nr:hypothetical protein [Chloroflexota bacterium]